MKQALTVLTLAIFLSCAAFAQPSATTPAFAMADVRTSIPGTRQSGGFLPEGRFECRGATMLKLISAAYGVTTDRVMGGPDWLTSDRFDITAKAPSPDASPAALSQMLQVLLADRFGLAVHNDRKDMPVYLLALGKKGPKLQPAANLGVPDCPSVNGEPSLNHHACVAFTMADLCKFLRQVAKNYLDRPVIDTTGLKGAYDFHLDWMSRRAYLAAKAKAVADVDAPPAVSIFQAVEKLGLKLEPGTHSRRVIVVDHVNRAPAEDAEAKNAPALPAHFEVGDVLPAKHGEREQGLKALPAGELEITGYSLKDLIALAFEVKGDRIAGGPKWLTEDRFDVVAKSPEIMSPHAMNGMLKALLVRRFKLETHSEDQPVQVFALVLGRRTPKLKKTNASARSECQLSLAEIGRAYACRNTTMAQLAERLPNVAQAYLTHPLIDLTGLKDAYDFTLSWTPRNLMPRRGPAGQSAQGAIPRASTPNGDLSVFAAIEQQLGLKIEEQKHPMPVIVIDHVEPLPAAQ